MVIENNKTNTFSEALDNFKKARESIDIALKNLNKTQKNLSTANNNFKQYQISKSNDYANAVSKFSIHSRDETTKLSTKKNFNTANNNNKQNKFIKSKDYEKATSKFSIPSLDETAKLLESQFISWYIEDEHKNQMIFIDEKKLKN